MRRGLDRRAILIIIELFKIEIFKIGGYAMKKENRSAEKGNKAALNAEKADLNEDKTGVATENSIVKTDKAVSENEKTAVNAGKRRGASAEH